MKWMDMWVLGMVGVIDLMGIVMVIVAVCRGV